MFLSGQCPGGAGLGQVPCMRRSPNESQESTQIDWSTAATARVERARNELGRTSWNKQNSGVAYAQAASQGVLSFLKAQERHTCHVLE